MNREKEIEVSDLHLFYSDTILTILGPVDQQ